MDLHRSMWKFLKRAIATNSIWSQQILSWILHANHCCYLLWVVWPKLTHIWILQRPSFLLGAQGDKRERSVTCIDFIHGPLHNFVRLNVDNECLYNFIPVSVHHLHNFVIYQSESTTACSSSLTLESRALKHAQHGRWNNRWCCIGVTWPSQAHLPRSLQFHSSAQKHHQEAFLVRLPSPLSKRKQHQYSEDLPS